MSTGRIVGATLTAVFAVTGTVVAAPAASAAPRRSYLVMTITLPGDRSQRVTLRCDPQGGTHPRAVEACKAVAAVRGNLRALRRTEGVMCLALYQPATAVATGTWRGHAVRYKKTFSNKCVLAVETGAVFQF
jgi:hypothetical protein